MLSAVALNSILWQSTRMIVPAFGGVLLAWFDTSVVFFLGDDPHMPHRDHVERIEERQGQQCCGGHCCWSHRP